MKREGKSICGSALIALFLMVLLREAVFRLWQGNELIVTLSKIPANLCVLWLCFAKKGNFGPVILFLLGDLLLNFSPMIGGGLFAAGHLLLTILFAKAAKADGRMLIRWGMVSLAAAAAVMLSATVSGLPGAVLFLYGFLLSMLLLGGMAASRLAGTGAAVFVLSDICLVLSIAAFPAFLFHTLCILLFYLSMVLIIRWLSGREGDGAFEQAVLQASDNNVAKCGDIWENNKCKP